MQAKLTPASLLGLIAKGESSTLELKARVPPEDVIARTIAAFANTEGGQLVVGVTDDRNIIGIPDDNAEEVLKRVRSIARSLLPMPIDVGLFRVNGRQVLCASVPKAEPHLSPVLTASGNVYRRIADRTVRLPEHAELELLRGGPLPQPTGKEAQVFVAMSFRQEEEPALVDYYSAMTRAVARAQLPLRLVRQDLMDGDYEISQQLMNGIDSADIVLVDFTLSPHNGYFEAGYARGRNKSLIQLARKGTELHFDVRNWRTEYYRNATELEDKLLPALQAAYAELTGQATS